MVVYQCEEIPGRRIPAQHFLSSMPPWCLLPSALLTLLQSITTLVNAACVCVREKYSDLWADQRSNMKLSSALWRCGWIVHDWVSSVFFALCTFWHSQQWALRSDGCVMFRAGNTLAITVNWDLRLTYALDLWMGCLWHQLVLEAKKLLKMETTSEEHPH